MSAVANPPFVFWTITAQRHLQQALAEPIARRGPQVFTETMNDHITARLRRIFRDAEAVVVQRQFPGYRAYPDEYILLVEVQGGARAGSHVVKLAPEPRLQSELAGWR